jgi:hypothetical protein
MADVLVGFSVQVVDAQGDKATFLVWKKMADTTSFVGLEAAANILGNLVDTMIDGVVTRVRAVFTTTPDTVKASPVAGSEVERCGLIQFDTDSEIRNFSLCVPAWSLGFFAGNTIDLADTDVLNFAHSFSDTYCEANGITIREPIAGKKTFRK